MAYLSKTLASLAQPARTIADDVLNPPADWIPRTGNIPSYQDWLAAQGPGYRPRGDNTPEYEYANQFYQLPTNRGDWLTLAPTVIGAAMTGGALAGALPAAGYTTTGITGATAAGGVGAAEAAIPVGGAIEGTAPLASMAAGSPAVTALPAATSGVVGSTALSRLLGLGQTGSDVLSLGGSLAPAVLGYFGADKTSDAYRDAERRYFEVGAPSRARLEASYAPGFDLLSQPGYGDALNRSAEIATRAASAKYGNPGENPGAIADITNQVWNQGYLPALANYRGQLMQGGGMGLNTSGLASLQGAEVAGGGIDAIGVGLGRAMTPQPSLADLYRQYLTVNGARV